MSLPPDKPTLRVFRARGGWVYEGSGFLLRPTFERLSPFETREEAEREGRAALERWIRGE